MNNYLEELKTWVLQGRENNKKYIIIIYDTIDKEYFPHYFDHDDVDLEWRKFISESKQKPIVSFKLNQQIKGVDL